jgi:phospholipase/lecithinase/hemolysin/uncharacterized protein YhjY with autotransporter beta-barrel domain
MTKLMSRALIGASAIALSALAASPASAQNVDRIVAFGDSLADSGNALYLLLNSPAVPPATKAQLAALYPTGRFSGGTNYIDTLSLILGVPTLNYAVGGAQTGPSNQFTGLPGFAVETGIFLSGATPPGTIFPANTGFQEGDLLALSIGVNDGRAFYQTNPGGTTAQAQAAAAISVATATASLDLLVAAGAPTISFVALNAGLTPDVLVNPALAALGNAFSTSFNAGFQTTLAGYAANGVMVHYLEGATVLANVAANPGAYGINALYCPAAPDPTCILNADGYLFYADGIHPTSDGMRIIAQYVAAQLTAPLTLQAPSDIAIDTARQFGRTLSGRMNFASFSDADTGLSVFVVGDMFSRRVDARDENDAFKITGHGGTAGVEYGFGGGVVGLAANLSRPKAEFGNDAARTKSKSVQLGGYAAMGFGGGFAQGYVGYGQDDHDIRRTGVVEAMSADADGKHWIAGAKAGYLVPLGAARIGPVVALDYAKAEVDSYTEEGDEALTLNVGTTRARSLRGSLGAEVRGALDMGGLPLHPYGALVVEKELSDRGRSVSFAQTSAPGIVNRWDFADTDKSAYGRLSAGLSAGVVGNVSLDGALSMTFGKKQGNDGSAHVGLKVGF